MERYSYEFLTECHFHPAIDRHSFKLRVEPMACESQCVERSEIVLTPATTLCRATDSFGNGVIYGLIEPAHHQFSVLSRGTVRCHPYQQSDPTPAEYYRYPTPLSGWDHAIRQLAAGLTPLQIMEAVNQLMRYERYATTNATTAIQAFQLGAGVCQDFAHVMLAACRSAGYLARYVNGMVEGEGETHAWVEVHTDGRWLGYDPTFCRPVTAGYLKVAHGRDTNDCPINRGRFFNWTTEQMTIKCKVTHDTDRNRP